MRKCCQSNKNIRIIRLFFFPVLGQALFQAHRYDQITYYAEHDSMLSHECLYPCFQGRQADL